LGQRRIDEKHYQVTWEDLEPWLQQLEEDHGVLCEVKVQLQGLPAGLKPAVRVEGRRWRVGQQYDTVFEDWRTFELRAVGQVEHLALIMLSNALMCLENDKWLAERGQTSLFAE
jgi:hypothetical protein